MFQSTTTCHRCNGEGKIARHYCNACHGEGSVRKEREIKIKIDKGIEDGTILKLSEEGDYVKGADISGDLYVVVHVKEHELFKRKGADLYYTLPITYIQAILGDKIEVPTISGKSVILTIPNGTQSDTMFKMKGYGMPYFQSSGYGNQYIKVNIEIPEKISKKEKELLEKIRELHDEPPYKKFLKKFF